MWHVRTSGEDSGAKPCPSGATAGDECPANDLQDGRGERELGARLTRPHAGPSEREEERGNDGRFDELQSAFARVCCRSLARPEAPPPFRPAGSVLPVWPNC